MRIRQDSSGFGRRGVFVSHCAGSLLPLTMRIIIVDDHQIMRDGLRSLLERDGVVQVVGEAANGRAGVERAMALVPDVVIMDLAMPELNGIGATQQLRAAGFAGGIVMLSSHDERRFVIQARDAGVDAYVHKDFAFEEVRAALDAAKRRDVFVSPKFARMAEEEGGLCEIAERLTPREREVLQMLAEGHSVKEIAFRFENSPKTIETHRMNLMAKLEVHNLADLTRLAVREGWVKI